MAALGKNGREVSGGTISLSEPEEHASMSIMAQGLVQGSWLCVNNRKRTSRKCTRVENLLEQQRGFFFFCADYLASSGIFRKFKIEMGLLLSFCFQQAHLCNLSFRKNE
jgi:hypothetical protein